MDNKIKIEPTDKPKESNEELRKRISLNVILLLLKTNRLCLLDKADNAYSYSEWHDSYLLESTCLAEFFFSEHGNDTFLDKYIIGRITEFLALTNSLSLLDQYSADEILKRNSYATITKIFPDLTASATTIPICWPNEDAWNKDVQIAKEYLEAKNKKIEIKK